MILTPHHDDDCAECKRLKRVNQLRTWLNVTAASFVGQEDVEAELERLETQLFNHTCEKGWS